MYSIILRTSIMFLIVMASVRIMGKKNLGEFQPTDLVSAILVSNLTSIVIECPELPILYSVIPVLLITCYEVFISVSARKSKKLADIAQGTSKILIINGIINQKVMRRLRLSIDDVFEAMRNKNIFYLQEVKLAIVETNGKVNIYPDPNADKNIKKANLPPFMVLNDGEIVKENLDYIKLSEKAVYSILKKEKVNKSEVLRLLVDSNYNYNLVIKEK